MEYLGGVILLSLGNRTVSCEIVCKFSNGIVWLGMESFWLTGRLEKYMLFLKKMKWRHVMVVGKH